MTRLNALQPLGLLPFRGAVGIILLRMDTRNGFISGRDAGFFLCSTDLPRYFVGISRGAGSVLSGGLLIWGLFTRVAALLLAIEMFVAIWKARLRGI